MKRISGLLLLSIFLAGCANIAPASAPTETATLTPTLVPTDTPQPTLTATPDPMKNAPKGATGYDEKTSMFYMEADDGYRYFYRKGQHDNDETDASWVRPLIENLYIYDDYDFNSIPTEVWVKYGTLGSQAIKSMVVADITDFDEANSMTGLLNTHMLTRFNMNETRDLKRELNSEQGIEYDFTFNNTKMHSSFGTDSGFRITLVSESELKPLYENKLAQRINTSYGYLYLIYDGVEDGKVLVRIAVSQSLDVLLKNIGGDPQFEFRIIFFLPIYNIITSKPEDDLMNISAATLAGIQSSKSADKVGDDTQYLKIITP